jgi:hypothetical protein
MSTITVPRPDLTTGEVVTVLRNGLRADYNVLPGMAIGQLAFQGLRQGQPNTIAVGIGDSRIVKAQVTITSQDGQTKLRIRPGGVTIDHLVNTFGIAREIHRALANSPSLSERSAT